MASLQSLAAELQLSIVELLDVTTDSFIPSPPRDLLSLSRVCKPLRNLTLPFLLKTITLLNEDKSGSSVLTILDSPYAEHVRNVHYIGVKVMPESPDWREDPIEPPSADDLPDSVEQVLSNLAKLPNLDRVTVQFACAKTEEKDDELYLGTYYLVDDMETDEQVLEEEQTVAYRSLMERSYRALSRNPPSTIKHLELKNIIAKECSAWLLDDFHAMLQGLKYFSISLRGGDNGAGWKINKCEGYLGFVGDLNVYLFQYLSNVEHFSFAATGDGPPGIDGAYNNTALPLRTEHMPQLKSLSLDFVFISTNLAEFITAHGDTLESICFSNCYSDGFGHDLDWAGFFSTIASNDMRALKVFHIGTSDLEDEKLSEKHYRHELVMRGKELREQNPGRRMYDYKTLDDKYGMVFDSGEMAFEKFRDGRDHAGWQKVCRIMERNAANDI